MPTFDLDARLLAAHATGDPEALVALYEEAADAATTVEAEGFYLTHAFVYALQSNHPKTRALNARLVAMGREAPLPKDFS